MAVADLNEAQAALVLAFGLFCPKAREVGIPASMVQIIPVPAHATLQEAAAIDSVVVVIVSD